MAVESEQLQAWARTCDEIAAALAEENDAVAVSAEFCALRMRRMLATRDADELAAEDSDA
jgi:hypothetical protein